MRPLLHFITCATDPEVLRNRLLASPCLAERHYGLSIYLDAASAAAAFNKEIEQLSGVEWLVWVHQDVFLPSGWDQQFISALHAAAGIFPRLAVAGVYGIVGASVAAQRAGHLLDRGCLLKEPLALPCRVDSLDELLFAVRGNSGLQLDPALRFDFYASDLALMAMERNLQAVVVDAYCEHWSSTPQDAAISTGLFDRILASGKVFEKKWAHRLPFATSCFSIERVGDVASQLQALICGNRHT